MEIFQYILDGLFISLFFISLLHIHKLKNEVEKMKGKEITFLTPSKKEEIPIILPLGFSSQMNISIQELDEIRREEKKLDAVRRRDERRMKK